MAKEKETAASNDDQYPAVQGTVGTSPSKSKRNSFPSHEEIQMAANEQVKLNAERAALNAKIGSFRKGLKLKGFKLKKLDAEVAKLEWSAEELRDDRLETDWYEEAMKQPVGAQLELYGDEERTPDGVREQLKWRQIGVRHGLSGVGWANDPPENCPPDCHQSYGEGHEEGQATVRRSFELRHAQAAAQAANDAADQKDAA